MPPNNWRGLCQDGTDPKLEMGQKVARLSFLFRGSKLLESKIHLNDSKLPPGTQRHQNNTTQT